MSTGQSDWPLSKSDYEELAEFRHHLRKFLRFSENAARSVGLTPNQHQLMLAVQGFPGRAYATPAELAERLQLQPHSCVGLINRCEEAGLVMRAENPDDKRSVHVRLTQQGLTVLERLTKWHRDELNRLGSDWLITLGSSPSLDDESP